MSGRKGTYGHNPQYPGKDHHLDDKEMMAEAEAEFPNTNQLQNKRYAQVLTDYYVCIGGYLD